MTAKPTLVMDQHFRRVDELFDEVSFARLSELCDIIGAVDQPMPRNLFEAEIEGMDFLVAAKPKLDATEVARSKQLKAVIEVSGTFQEGLDYGACFDRGIEVLSCAPGFQYSVAEMTVAMILAGGRGLVQEHEAFRAGREHWLSDEVASDFTMYDQSIGFVGFGAIARECCRLLAPFRPQISAYDPWLDADTLAADGIAQRNLDDLAASCRCIVIAAAPTDENWQLVGRRQIERMQPGTLVVVISRSHLVDFPVLVAAANEGRIRLAIDVFPEEPLPADAPIRSTPNVILSPHRAAAVPGGRHPIGRMIVHDIEAVLAGRPERHLQSADPARIAHILGAPAMRAKATA
ncbi:MAG: NAD(P)-dependent oxidoreductase [Rhodobacter sp.]|nr:NAD(P)-dependent oxidoreductase [Rhodobacter sp.]